MENKILDIKNSALADIEKVNDTKDLENFRNLYLSRNCELTNIKKSLKDLPQDLRPKIGALANQVYVEIEKIANEKYEFLYKK